eukprot:scaffold14997_cov22-Tisochrysis_lutea.AAC.1
MEGRLGWRCWVLSFLLSKGGTQAAGDGDLAQVAARLLAGALTPQGEQELQRMEQQLYRQGKVADALQLQQAVRQRKVLAQFRGQEQLLPLLQEPHPLPPHKGPQCADPGTGGGALATATAAATAAAGPHVPAFGAASVPLGAGQ